MPAKGTSERTKMLILRTVRLTDHWKLDILSKDLKQGKEEIAAGILHDYLKKIKLEIEQ